MVSSNGKPSHMQVVLSNNDDVDVLDILDFNHWEGFRYDSRPGILSIRRGANHGTVAQLPPLLPLRLSHLSWGGAQRLLSIAPSSSLPSLTPSLVFGLVVLAVGLLCRLVVIV